MGRRRRTHEAHVGFALQGAVDGRFCRLVQQPGDLLVAGHLGKGVLDVLLGDHGGVDGADDEGLGHRQVAAGGTGLLCNSVVPIGGGAQRRDRPHALLWLAGDERHVRVAYRSRHVELHGGRGDRGR